MIKKIVISLLFCLVITGCAGRSDTISIDAGADGEKTEEARQTKADEASSGESEVSEPADADGIYIYVCGWVKKSGVYRLPRGARACDAVEAAGGFKKKADRDYVNLAEALSDGQQIYIPSKAEVSVSNSGTSAGTGSTEGSTGGRINLNTATREELMTLTGIGEAKADAIISYREQAGLFSRIEDIMNISGIKEGVFSKIKDDITV